MSTNAELLMQLWSSLPVPAILLDAEERIADMNPAAEGFMNNSAKWLVGQPIWDRLAVDAPLEESLGRARQHGTPLFVNDVDVGTGARPPLVCNLQLAPVQNYPGWFIMLISPRELAGRMTQSHSVKSAAKSAIGMAEMLAHEIKNPLAGIAGAAQLLSMSLTKDDLELTDLIVAETRRIVKLLEQVEQFGNLSAPEMKPVNIHDVLDRARRSTQLGAGAHMKFVEEYDPSLPLAYGDPDQLLQVVLNLLKNAAEAADSKAGGVIRLHTFYEHSFRMRRADGSTQKLPLQVEVIDDGPGLPEDIRGDIFDPFVSGRENGTGLGLALVSKIISDHDGWISVDSVPGRTVFRISLPRAPRESEENR
ncbi:nitrogen regulation protein NR(II) [Salipiger marinus]|jgi:two-component system nitrogen regulation sensor histidine kinase GlnL|uniref:histidine kinase n=1 Tax=Salipiger marinus TaxID=555512 RepID=A0A1G8PMX9_9RHOB|nr:MULTISPECIES: ATP-binding protein [Salipiger]HBM58326.1 PAS domain-containing sensor histidine kinase [Citreicella sp.]MCD1619472.1 PAS domain-containing sensor histidine kinase [Salipiger manganoxidans]MEB3420306.1 ATP-binding protein [Salipiger manganoxidans]SDI93817.1 two-component system, NtrC family, nitrogen regulation sensor histidine kinase GlnL [Salipiger marinus]HBT00162.1 PAS domain-containing sensor histidine kinase [Citreicella sp.]